MICPYCGETLKDTARFCTNCGKQQSLPGEKPAAENTHEAQPEQPASGTAGENPIDAGSVNGEWPPHAEDGAEAPHPESNPQYGPAHQGQASSAQTPQAEKPASGMPEPAEILLAAASLLLFFWFGMRLIGIAAAVFAVRAYLKRKNGDEAAAAESKKICVILLLAGLGLKILGWVLRLIFRIGAGMTLFSWLRSLL